MGVGRINRESIHREDMSEGMIDKDLLLEKNVIFFSKVNRFCGFQSM